MQILILENLEWARNLFLPFSSDAYASGSGITLGMTIIPESQGAGKKWKEWTYLSLLSAHLSKVAHCLTTKRQRQRRLGDLALEDVNNKLVLAQGICHLSLWWLNRAAAAVDLWHILKGSSGCITRMRHLVLQETDGTGVGLVRYFQELTFNPILASFHTRKALNPFMVTSAPCD